MTFSKDRISILWVRLCCLYLCLATSTAAATMVDAAGPLLFEPGKEYHVVTNNEAIGMKRFNLYVPRDYTEDRAWPVIFRYKGRGEKYNPIICRGARSATCDRGAIVVGMAYLEYGRKRMTAPQFRDYTRRELRSIHEVRKLISKYLNIDHERLFLSGSSAGGWLVSQLLEYRAQDWAGAMIFVAGRHPSASALTNDYSSRAFRGMPVFFGSSLPGTSHGGNHKWAIAGAVIYEHRGAMVTFQVYAGEGLVSSPLLRDWVRTYVLGDGANSTAQQGVQSKPLTREMPHEIDSAGIIRAQIAKTLHKRLGQLTQADLGKVRELSLMGQYISDISYLARLPHLESLDISFTYVDTVEPLLNCRNLRRLDISDTHVRDISPLQHLPELRTLSMWDLWLAREHIDDLKEKLPSLEVVDYQWDLYERDSIGRVLPRRRVTLK